MSIKKLPDGRIVGLRNGHGADNVHEYQHLREAVLLLKHQFPRKRKSYLSEFFEELSGTIERRSDTFNSPLRGKLRTYTQIRQFLRDLPREDVAYPSKFGDVINNGLLLIPSPFGRLRAVVRLFNDPVFIREHAPVLVEDPFAARPNLEKVRKALFYIVDVLEKECNQTKKRNSRLVSSN